MSPHSEKDTGIIFRCIIPLMLLITPVLHSLAPSKKTGLSGYYAKTKVALTLSDLHEKCRQIFEKIITMLCILNIPYMHILYILYMCVFYDVQTQWRSWERGTDHLGTGKDML